MLAVLVHRRVVGTQAIDHPVGESPRQRIAVAVAPERRLEAAMRIEVAQVHVAEVDMMNGDVASYRQSLLLRPAHELDYARGREPAHVHAGAGGAHELEDRGEGDGLGKRRNAGQAEPRR